MAARAANLFCTLDAAVGGMPERLQRVCARRALCWPARSLAEVGQELGITRERVRQLEQKIARRLDDSGDLARRLDAELLRLRQERSTPLSLTDLASLSLWFAGAARPRHHRRLGGLLELLRCKHRLIQPAVGVPFVSLALAVAPRELTRRCSVRLAQPAFFNCTRATKEAAIAGWMAELGVGELAGMVVELLAANPHARRGARLEPTLVERVETLLQEAGRPLTTRQILAALPEHSPRLVHNAIVEADVVQCGRSTHVLRSQLRHFDHLLPRVRDDAVELMRGEPGRQWQIDYLLQALVQAGASWAIDLPPHGLEHLLRQLPEVSNLRRSYWGLAGAHRERLHIDALATQILEEHGQPMPRRELLRRIGDHRPVGPAPMFRFPVLRLDGAMVALGPRDLRLPAATWRRFLAAVRERAAAAGPVDDALLQQCFVAVGEAPQRAQQLLPVLRREASIARLVGLHRGT